MAESLITFNDDLVPASRKKMTPYHLQAGDCVLHIPPTAIDVRAVSNINMLRGLRQRNPIMTQSGYSQTEIRAPLWFNSIEEINGIAVPGAGGETYYMDGLRPLIAQFRRAPIMPVFNELVNDTHGIYTGILSNLTVETVPEFPNALAGTLIMYRTTIEPYMMVPDEAFADYICWPVFRWYYQGLMNGRSAEYLAPVRTGRFTGSFSFSVVKEDVLAAADAEGQGYLPAGAGTGRGMVYITGGFEIVKIDNEDRAIMPLQKLANHMGLPAEWKPPEAIIGGHKFRPYKIVNDVPWMRVRVVGETLGYRVIWNRNNRTIIMERTAAATGGADALEDIMMPVEMPDTLHLTHLVVALGNAFVNTHVQMHSAPCHQYLGSMDKQIVATFETRDREAVAALKSLQELTNYYSLRYRNRLVSGFVGFQNELAELFGIRHVMIQNLHTATVPEHPGLFRIALSMVEFDRMQRAYERAEAINYIENLPGLKEAIGSVNIYDMTEIELSCLIEEMIEGFNLYPDLDLPSHSELEDAIARINSQRAAHGLKPIELKQPGAPHAGPFVDPDFYVDYSHFTKAASNIVPASRD